MRKDFRVYWHADKWVVDTDFGLTQQTLAQIASMTLKTQQQRYSGLPPGPVKDECKQTIDALLAGRISQNIAGPGDRVLFDAYKSDKIIVGA